MMRTLIALLMSVLMLVSLVSIEVYATEPGEPPGNPEKFSETVRPTDAYTSEALLSESETEQPVEESTPESELVQADFLMSSSFTSQNAMSSGSFSWPTSSKRINALDHYSNGNEHGGIDINASLRSDVYAIASGRVVRIRNGCPHESKGSGHSCYSDGWSDYGNYIVLEHTINGTTYTSVYAHLTQSSMVVSEGDNIYAGQKIALSGSSGSSSGPHLHLEIYEGAFRGSIKTLRSKSFQYYLSNTSVLQDMTFSSHVNKSSVYFGSWVEENCTLTNGVWKYTGATTPSLPYINISVETRPSGDLPQNNSFGLRGIITSYPNLTNVTAQIINTLTNSVVEGFNYAKSLNATSYNIQTDGLNDAFVFNKLPIGNYRYVVKATNSSVGTRTLIDSYFTIGGGSTPSTKLTVTANEATSVTQNNAIVGGYISFGNEKPTVWGIDVTTDRSNWKDKNVPLRISNAITDWSGTGKSISVNFATDAKSNPLQPNTTYYYRFWVKYSDDGYIHSDDNGVAPKSFKTKAPESTYTLSFDSSGGTIVNAINVRLDNQFTIPSAAKTGYTLKGWYSKRNDNTWHVKSKGWFTEAQISSNKYEKEIYTVGRAPTFDTSWTEGNTNASFTFYAVWEINTLSMQYNGNGGNVGANEYSFSLDNDGYILRNSNRTVGAWKYGTTYEDGLINNTSFTLSRPGYVFQGWRLGEDAAAVIYDQDAPLTPEQICPELKNKNMTVTFYAVWEKGTYAINYDPNGGTGAPEAQTKTHDTALTLSSMTPTRANASAGSYTVTLNANGGCVDKTSLSAARTTSYTFKNWNTAANGSGTGYNPGASYTANAAATLYAQWNSSTTTAAVTLPTPTRSGYSFLGWATSSTAASGVTGSYTPSGNVTLYAIWQKQNPDFVLPGGLHEVEEEAFAGAAFSYVHMPEQVTKIGKRAFADCPNLRNIDIPARTTAIDATAFEGVSELTIHGSKGSFAEFYAGKYGFDFVAD